MEYDKKVSARAIENAHRVIHYFSHDIIELIFSSNEYLNKTADQLPSVIKAFINSVVISDWKKKYKQAESSKEDLSDYFPYDFTQGNMSVDISKLGSKIIIELQSRSDKKMVEITFLQDVKNESHRAQVDFLHETTGEIRRLKFDI